MGKQGRKPQFEKKFKKSAWLRCPIADDCEARGCPHKKKHREKKDCTLQMTPIEGEQLCPSCAVCSKPI